MSERRSTGTGRASGDTAAPQSSSREPELIAYRIGPAAPRIEPAPSTRDWMDATPGKFAYRCLPLAIANQNGWVLLNPSEFRVMWNGSARSDGLRFRYRGEEAPALVTSVFGSGIVTWRIPFLFRTPAGYDLLVRGATNQVKRGAVALDGLVETDWAVSTFTMNWKITNPLRWITFGQDEPFCMIQPQRRGEIEAFRPATRDIDSDPELAKQVGEWAESRENFVLDRIATPPVERQPSWQKDYFKGDTPDGTIAAGHRVKLDVRPFADAGSKTARAEAPSRVWQHYAERTPGLARDVSALARLLAWGRFWYGALRR